MAFQFSYFKSWKMTLWKCALNMPANLENSAVATGQEKVSFHSSLKEGQCRKCSNYQTTALISYASKVMLKILQASLQQHVNQELPDFQAGFRKGRGTRDQHPLDHRKSKRVPEKHLFLLYWLCQTFWLCGSRWTMENSERDKNTKPPDLPLDKPVGRSGSNS